MQERSTKGMESKWRSAMVEAVTPRVLDRLAELSGAGNYPPKAMCTGAEDQ
jgi:hypothetical protein